MSTLSDGTDRASTRRTAAAKDGIEKGRSLVPSGPSLLDASPNLLRRLGLDRAVETLSRQLEEAQKHFHINPITDFSAVKNVPGNDIVYGLSSALLTLNLVGWWLERLDETDQVLVCQKLNVESPPVLVPELPPKARQRILNKLDEIIFEQVRTIGPVVFILSDLVQSRVLQWWHSERYGHELLGRFGREVATGARVKRHLSKLPLNAKMKAARKELIQEMKTLHGVLRGRFSQRQLPDRDQILLVAMDIVTDRAQPFERLRSNSISFRRFIEKEPIWLVDLVSHKTTPTMFVDAWLAQTTNRSEESLRQAISRMGDKS